MSDERVTHTIYADHMVSEKSGKGRYSSKTFNLNELIEEVGPYASITIFLNEREVGGENKKSASIIFNKSDAKYMPRKDSSGERSSESSPGSAPGRRDGMRRV